MKFSELSASEKRLIGIMGFLVAVLFNVVVGKFFIKTREELRRQASTKQELSASLRDLAASGPVWEKRAQWLQKAQPKLESEPIEGNALLNLVKERAARNGLSVSKQQLLTARSEGGVTAVPVQFEFKGPWKGVCTFFAELQGPDAFLVVQQSRLRVDPADATQMLCDCVVAKWFAAR